MISDAAKDDLKARNPCDQVAARWVKLRRKGKRMIGPCPLHSADPAARDSTSFECDAEGWVCATCADGGDVIKLLMLREQIDFPAAVAQLGGVVEPDPARAVELERARVAKREQTARDNNVYRERERETIYQIWKRGTPLAESFALQYLHDRGLAVLPLGLKLRCIADMPYYASGAKDAEIVHRGPCMLAPIVDADGKFRALHMTWIDPQRPGCKASIPDSITFGTFLPAKKVRGSKAGNAIRLVEGSEPWQLVIGEGIETVLSVWYAMREAPRDVDGAAFWSAVDLGNLAGASIASVPHPELKDARGRSRHVPGPQPDLSAASIAIPDSVTDLVLLGDGDSDRFTTQCALARATVRYAKPGRTVRTAWAPAGMDFNDVLRAA